MFRSAGATWGVTSNNWGLVANPALATPWDSTHGPTTQADFITAGGSANATGNNLYTFILDFQSNSTGDTITGGTLNVSQTTYGIYNQATSGTNTISSAIVMATPGYIQNTVSSSSVYLNLTGPITTTGAGALQVSPASNTTSTGNSTIVLAGDVSTGTMQLNPGGNTPSSGYGATIALGGTDSFNLLQETNHGTILIQSGGSVSCTTFYVVATALSWSTAISPARTPGSIPPTQARSSPAAARYR